MRFLDSIKTKARAVYLLGDMFDFWCEWRYVVPKGYTRFLGKLSELTDMGVEVHYFTGNHDIWTYGYLKEECGLIVHTKPETVEIYDKVFEGEVECGTLEEVYQMFNIGQPDGYRGRSLSVSDVVEVVGEEKSTFHFCDSIGFREVDFDPDMTEPLKEKKIKVVLCEPGKVARVAEIGTELSDLQRVVGGLIEPYYPFEEQVCIVCNDEGKYNGMRPCRAIYGEDREMMDIIFGPFFICDCSTPYFGSLNKEQLERYKKQFQNPEHFFRVGGEIKAVPYKPEKDHER